VGLAQVGVDAVAGTAAFSDDIPDTDTNASGVSDTPAGTAAAAQGALPLRDALHGNGFALPAVKAKDAVGFCDRLPPLQVGQGAAGLAAGLDLGAIEWCGKGSDLLGGEDSGAHGNTEM
jgi:hypothetical protein